jgi:hypothetical protein
MVKPSHPSQKVANEYDAKHEPDVAKKMANLWESKVVQNDGGQLSPTFAQSPEDIAKSRTKPTKHATVQSPGYSSSARGTPSADSSSTADSGPRSFSHQKSVVEIKSKYEGSAGASREELERKVKAAVAEANAAAAREAKRIEEQHARDREEQRAETHHTLATLEKQLAAVNETLEVLRAQVNA